MNTNASEERLVVTCPACETKFAVVRSALSQVATPRFHCSRCDNVFVVSVDQLSTLEPQATSEDNFEPEVEEPEAFEEIPHKANPTSPMFPQPDEYQGVESDMGEAAQKANPTTELNETKEIKQALGKIADEPVSEFIAVPSMGAAEYQNADDRAFKPEKPNPHYAEQAGLFDSIDDEDERYRDADSSPEFLATQDDIAEMQVVRKHSPWRACIFISAPIALCLVGLFVISIAVKQFPDLLSPYIPSSIAALPNIAPSGLYISDLRFKKMDLDSGEIVGVIAGTLHNDTSEEFKTVVLEGLGFDEEGNAVSSVRITAGAGLGSAKVKSLSREMINDLQARPPIKKFSLAPQDSYSFSIALTEHKPEKLAHYSARVYSVVR